MSTNIVVDQCLFRLSVSLWARVLKTAYLSDSSPKPIPKTFVLSLQIITIKHYRLHTLKEQGPNMHLKAVLIATFTMAILAVAFPIANGKSQDITIGAGGDADRVYKRSRTRRTRSPISSIITMAITNMIPLGEAWRSARSRTLPRPMNRLSHPGRAGRALDQYGTGAHTLLVVLRAWCLVVKRHSRLLPSHVSFIVGLSLYLS